jgi:hypothetical protein
MQKEENIQLQQQSDEDTLNRFKAAIIISKKDKENRKQNLVGNPQEK